MERHSHAESSSAHAQHGLSHRCPGPFYGTANMSRFNTTPDLRSAREVSSPGRSPLRVQTQGE